MKFAEEDRAYLDRQFELYREAAVLIKTPVALRKFRPLEELLAELDLHRAQNQIIVVASGAFILPHFGHADYFEQAKEYGNVLIVSLNSDNSINLNGRCKDFVPFYGRVVDIASRGSVDYVVLFDEKLPSAILEFIKPEVYAKGADWKDKELPEEKIIEENGGRVVYIETRYNVSSTHVATNVIVHDKRSPGNGSG